MKLIFLAKPSKQISWLSVIVFLGASVSGWQFYDESYVQHKVWEREVAIYKEWLSERSAKSCDNVMKVWLWTVDKNPGCSLEETSIAPPTIDEYLDCQNDPNCPLHVKPRKEIDAALAERKVCEKKIENEPINQEAILRGCLEIIRDTYYRRKALDNPGSYPAWFSLHLHREYGSNLPPLFLSIAASLGIFLLLQIGRLLYSEPSEGWRRLTIAISCGASLLAIPATLIFADDRVDINLFIYSILFGVMVFPSCVLMVLGVRRIVKWVRVGFTDTDNLPVSLCEVNHSLSTPTSREQVSPPQSLKRTEAHPIDYKSLPLASYWTRVWARMIDVSLIYLASCLIFAILPSSSEFLAPLPSIFTDLILFQIVLCFGLIWYDTLFLSRYATTPGKYLLGIRVQNLDGEALSRQDAYDRGFSVLRHGLWYLLFFPRLQIVNALIFARRKKGFTWDFHGHFRVCQRLVHPVRKVFFGVLAVLLVLFFSGQQPMLKTGTHERISWALSALNW